MAAYFLSGISDVRQALASEPEVTDPQVQEALKALHESEGIASLGFKKRAAAIRKPAEARRELEDRGVKVSDSQLADVLKAEEARHTRLLSRRRFWVQLLISVLVAVFAMSMIAWGKTDSALEKGLFGLLGTVLGYWLR